MLPGGVEQRARFLEVALPNHHLRGARRTGTGTPGSDASHDLVLDEHVNLRGLEEGTGQLHLDGGAGREHDEVVAVGHRAHGQPNVIVSVALVAAPSESAAKIVTTWSPAPKSVVDAARPAE